MVAEQKRLGHEGWPNDCLKMETHARLSHGGGLAREQDRVQEIMKNSSKKNVNVALLGDDKTACDMKKTRRATSNDDARVVCEAEGRMFSLSWNTEHTVAKMNSSCWRSVTIVCSPLLQGGL